MSSTGAGISANNGVGTSVPSSSINKNGTKVPTPKGYKQTKVGVIPEYWDVVKLGEYIDELEAGVSVNSIDSVCQNDTEKGILKTSAVSEGKFISSENKKIIKKDIGRAKLNPKQGNLIISRMNTPELVGAIAIIEKDCNNLYLPDRLWQTKFSETKRLNSFWLNYLLNTYKYKSKVKSLGTGTSGSMKNISKKAFLKVEIPLPPLKEQQKIAQILTTWDDAISKQEALIKAKEELKKGLMQRLLSGEVRFDGFDGEWGEVTFGKILNQTQSGLSRKLSSSDIGVAVIRSNNIKDNIIDITDLKYWYKIDPQGSNLDNYFLNNDDILVNFINSLAQIGKMAIYRNELKNKIIFTTNILRVKFNKKVEIEFIKYIFQTKNYNNFILSISKPAVNQASFTTKDFRKFKIKLPPKGEQQKIAQVLTLADKEIDLLKTELDVFKEQKRGLMQGLLSGEVRVVV